MSTSTKRIVISAVNLTEAGFLSVLKDCLGAFKKIYKTEGLEIIVLVHKTELVSDYMNDFTIIEYPQIKPSWFKRIWFEYVECKKISEKINPYLWIALHDISPRVNCKQVVYCHNPTPFYKLKGHEIFSDRAFVLMCLFYRYLYAINIKKNSYVIVQQEWLRRAFEKSYDVKAIVAQPINTSATNNDFVNTESPKIRNTKFQFFYPAFPRVAKNFEVLLKATVQLSKIRNDFEVLLTTSGNETKHAIKLYDEYKNIKTIKFTGIKTRSQIFELFNKVNCMVFPSNLETWGLPITEFKPFNKPMLLVDMEYAHETLGEYSKAKFFDYNDHHQLAGYMNLIIDSKLEFDKNSAVTHPSPFFNNWDELVMFLADEL
jgi:glycosyltransferase involved in cell wall biosynthesis